MSIEFSQTVITARLSAFTTALDGASPAGGKLRIYDGTRPATGGAITAQVKLVEFTWPIPSLDNVTGDVLTLDLPPGTTALATGTASWARCVDGAGVFVADLGVGIPTSGDDIEMSTLAIFVGGAVAMSSATLEEV